jgi:hypothetical protein
MGGEGLSKRPMWAEKYMIDEAVLQQWQDQPEDEIKLMPLVD